MKTYSYIAEVPITVEVKDDAPEPTQQQILHGTACTDQEISLGMKIRIGSPTAVRLVDPGKQT